MQKIFHDLRFDITYRILDLIRQKDTLTLSVESEETVLAIISATMTIIETMMQIVGEFLIVIAIISIIILRKQRKTQKMLRELNEKLDKLQPTSNPGQLNTEDTESAE